MAVILDLPSAFSKITGDSEFQSPNDNSGIITRIATIAAVT